jgi:hypothetical protein
MNERRNQEVMAGAETHDFVRMPGELICDFTFEFAEDDRPDFPGVDSPASVENGSDRTPFERDRQVMLTFSTIIAASSGAASTRRAGAKIIKPAAAASSSGAIRRTLAPSDALPPRGLAES